MVLAAFLFGLGIAFLLEAMVRWRLHRSRPWRLLGWALLAVCLGVWLWPWPPQAELVGREPTATAVWPSPSPPARLAQPIATWPPTAVAPPAADPATYLPTAVANPRYLHIPKLNLSRPIVPVAVQDGQWDVAVLGADVGLLAGIGRYPQDDWAMVFAGHMTFADEALLAEGAFANLGRLTYGSQVLLELEGETAVYEVVDIQRIAPDAVDALYVADGDAILLLTCTDWNETDGEYVNRLLIRAERIAK